MKDDLPQKIHRNIMFSLYSVKMIFVKKNKDDLFRKNAAKDCIFDITGKNYTDPRNDGIGILY